MRHSPISFADVESAAARLAPHLAPTAVRQYPRLDADIGHGITVFVKHENHQPTQSFKIRNGLNAVLGRSEAERARGGIGASTGNHGLGIAYAGRLTGTPITVCVPEGNNPEKNEAIRALGATLVEAGATYDATIAECHRLQEAQGLALLHSTNDPLVIAGAGTMTLEYLAQAPALDALVLALGGGSQAVGALAVTSELRPALKVYAVGAAGAPAQFESWRLGERLERQPVDTFAEGIATGSAYALTFDALRAGLAGFVQVTDVQMRAAIRDLLRYTGNLAEGAGAAGLAGLRALAPQLAGQRVGIVMCGGNLSLAELQRTMAAP
ncbi:MAG: threonine/serine dehydratase [Gemmatimonas sp.]|nr:threonine/serine dehydratase [Gemmatimonas sp.]